jgi:hypothetical protein
VHHDCSGFRVDNPKLDGARVVIALSSISALVFDGDFTSSVRLQPLGHRQRAISVPMTLMQTVATMGLLGLTLASIGLYGLIAHSVSRRTKEIGIRMAIGAGQGGGLAHGAPARFHPVRPPGFR